MEEVQDGVHGDTNRIDAAAHTNLRFEAEAKERSKLTRLPDVNS